MCKRGELLDKFFTIRNLEQQLLVWQEIRNHGSGSAILCDFLDRDRIRHQPSPWVEFVVKAFQELLEKYRDRVSGLVAIIKHPLSTLECRVGSAETWGCRAAVRIFENRDLAVFMDPIDALLPIVNSVPIFRVNAWAKTKWLIERSMFNGGGSRSLTETDIEQLRHNLSPTDRWILLEAQELFKIFAEAFD